MGGQLGEVASWVALRLGNTRSRSIMSSSPAAAPTHVARRWKNRWLSRLSPTVCMAMTRMRSASHGLPCRHMQTRPATKAAGLPACTRMEPPTAEMAWVKSSAGRMPPVLDTQKPRNRLQMELTDTEDTRATPYSQLGVAEVEHHPRMMMYRMAAMPSVVYRLLQKVCRKAER